MVQPWIIGLYFAQHGSTFLAAILFIIAGIYGSDFLDILNNPEKVLAVKSMRFTKDNVPPELKDFVAMMEKEQGLKCDNPHCENCHPESAPKE